MEDLQINTFEEWVDNVHPERSQRFLTKKNYVF